MPDQRDAAGFVLFRNDKPKNANSPKYTGFVTWKGEPITLHDGDELELSGWVRTSKKNGATFIGGTARPKEQRQQQRPAERRDELPPPRTEKVTPEQAAADDAASLPF